MEQWKEKKWDKLPSERRQAMLFAIDEIIENNMVVYPCGTTGAKPSKVIQEAKENGYSEALCRKIIQMMEDQMMIFCSVRLIHRFSDVQELWPEYSLE